MHQASGFASNPGFTSNQYNKPEEFKGKLDTLISNMPEFHEDTNFPNWLNMVKMLARATKCFDVLEPNYVPTTLAEQSAFSRFKIRCSWL
eukprot:scaffold764_cov93-Skeletonema_dohrnii-CCMP3373.AAC.2